jgi:NADPH:quinone reductase-like Zn-dependent oxidoreductase
VSAIIAYGPMSALVIHLGLDKPSKNATPKGKNFLIWGGGSDFGFYAVQIAAQVPFNYPDIVPD